MNENGYNWRVGDVVNLPIKTSRVNKSGVTVYEHLIYSHYVCIRECKGTDRGILVRVLGKTPRFNIKLCGGEPFCKDRKDELFTSNVYYSYRFPKLDELKNVLDIIRNNQELIDVFEKASMHININSTFWVRDTASRLLLLKDPQYFDAQSDQLLTAGNDDSLHYRITIAYFYKSQINW